MKTIRLFAFAVMTLLAGSVYAQKIVVNDVKVEAGATTAEMVITLQENTTEVANWQAFITLPDGFKFTKKKVSLDPSLYPTDEDEEVMHIVDLSSEGQTFKLMVYCNPTTPLKSNNGKLATITLTVPEGFSGSKVATVTNIHLSTASSVDTAVPDVTFNIADESAGISSVLLDASAKAQKVYNLNGQRVSDNFKGIVVMDGKKFIGK